MNFFTRPYVTKAWIDETKPGNNSDVELYSCVRIIFAFSFSHVDIFVLDFVKLETLTLVGGHKKEWVGLDEVSAHAKILQKESIYAKIPICSVG